MCGKDDLFLFCFVLRGKKSLYFAVEVFLEEFLNFRDTC